MISKLPDALADALGRVVADLQREWRREVERNAAESRAVIAELRADVVALKAELRERADQESNRVAAAVHGIRSGDPGAPGRDGVGVAGAIIDRDGILTLTMSDGTARALGSVVGKDGASGRDGEPGKDGRDGFGFEDMTEELGEDGRTIIRRYSRGDEVKEFRHTMAVILDRGVYKADTGYARGDAVSYGGCLWIAQDETQERPGDGKSWRLSVKKGRDGKDGVIKHQAVPKPVKVG